MSKDHGNYEWCDDEWILRKAQGTYFLRIGEFLKKTRWPAGMFLDSKVFLIGNTKFKLRFYPNNSQAPTMKTVSSHAGSGSEGSPPSDSSPAREGFVGVYLYNESQFDVLADIVLKVGPKALTLNKQFLRGNDCVGESHKQNILSCIGVPSVMCSRLALCIPSPRSHEQVSIEQGRQAGGASGDHNQLGEEGGLHTSLHQQRPPARGLDGVETPEGGDGRGSQQARHPGSDQAGETFSSSSQLFSVLGQPQSPS